MARGLTSAVQTELATKNINPVHLVSIGFSSTVYLTDASFNITYDSNTYLGNGALLSIDNTLEGVEPSLNSIDIVLEGASQTYISLVLSENLTGDTVIIHRGYLNSSNTLISDPFILWSGKAESYSISESEKESQVKITCASHWADFDKVNGRNTNNSSQQRFFSNDKGFEFASLITTNIKWGRE